MDISLVGAVVGWWHESCNERGTEFVELVFPAWYEPFRVKEPLNVGTILSTIADRGAAPALRNVVAFNEARLRVIADNVANAQTPGYRAKQLDVQAFQKSLGEALERRDHFSKPFVVDGNREAQSGGNGFLQVTPTLRPVDNVLFQDGTNVSIEREMADLAETAMAHDLATGLLRDSQDGIRKAIRGTVA